MKIYSILVFVFASLLFTQVGFAQQQAPKKEKQEKTKPVKPKKSKKEKAAKAKKTDKNAKSAKAKKADKAKKKGAIDNTMFKPNPDMEASRKRAHDAKKKSNPADQNVEIKPKRADIVVPRNYGMVRSDEAKAKIDSALNSKHSAIKRSSQLIDEAYIKIEEAKKALAKKIKARSISKRDIELEQARIARAEEKVKRLEIRLDSSFE